MNFKVPFILIFLTIALYASNYSIAQNIEIKITNIRSDKGYLLVGVFKDNESFKSETPAKKIKITKTKMANGTVTVKISLDPGIYGFSLLDDENNNAEMDYTFLGIPKEGYGFSNY